MKIWNVFISLEKKYIFLWNSVTSLHTDLQGSVWRQSPSGRSFSVVRITTSFFLPHPDFSEFLLGHMQNLEERFWLMLGVRLSQRVALWSVIYIVFQHIIQYEFFLIMLLFEENRCPVQTRLVSVKTYCWSSMSIMKYFLKA